MPLTKAKGNMYDWCSNLHTHLGGKCQHSCTYCYINSFRHRCEKYQGPLRLIDKELDVKYGKGKVIFLEHCNDLFADDVKHLWISAILRHAREYPDNEYVLQTKNPGNVIPWIRYLPPTVMIGTTIETNRIYPDISKAPIPEDRYEAMCVLSKKVRTFLTIEPILSFDVAVLAGWIRQINPKFVNIGADSKNHSLPEPDIKRVEVLIEKLQKSGIQIREKSNLERLRR